MFEWLFFCVFKVKVLICLISYNNRFLKVHILISQKSLERICEASLSRPSTLCLEYQAQNQRSLARSSVCSTQLPYCMLFFAKFLTFFRSNLIYLLTYFFILELMTLRIVLSCGVDFRQLTPYSEQLRLLTPPTIFTFWPSRRYYY